MFFHTASCAFASLDSLPTGTVQRALLSLPTACFRGTTAGTVRNRFLRGPVAMSSLRQLNADRLQIDCPRALLIMRVMRATRHFLKQSVTIRSMPCFSRAVAVACLEPSIHLFALLNRQFTSSWTDDSCFVRIPQTPTPAHKKSCSELWNSTKRRLNLHTRPAPPAASF
jgi:hypothetical protein